MNRKHGRTKAAVGASLLSLMLVLGGCGSNAANNAANTDNGAENDTGTQSEQTAAPTEKLKVETSFYPMYEFARSVGGDLADVHLLVPAGMEPHDWEPTPQDIAKIQEADLLVYNGAGMESWVDQVVNASSGSKMTPVEASAGLEIMESAGGHSHSHGDDHDHDHDGAAEEGHDHDHDAAAEEGHDHDHDAAAEEGHDHDHDAAAEEGHDHDHDAAAEEGHGHHHDHGGLDPHVWLSPAEAIREVRNIEAAFAKADPDNADQYKSNADTYAAKLEELDKEFKDGLSNTKRKDFITQHAAFGYLARDYGLTQVPIAGLSPDQEPSAQGMAEVIEFAKEHDVKTIFFETLVSSQVAEAIASEIGAKTDVLNPLEGLTAEEEAAGKDYLSVMRTNLEALKAALNE
ncbi:metal ABC transporter substrate-binding protein [Saccharibacillus alkalitolerans]|uniref:Zinc ABC transporter substrate-binding protein n=1 Tax=Saccharibacillus alkalitolerans TaxID=2705290 RepID=A0ABX0FBP3_9BACL|nr:metal ABC transporter substrate-binding protein [Saccharibacillus alkalitolerans]NGZ77825.1 zinc ABC transporter substrate-binding protein [Saccharibacillus alkalitolerans]